jgi:hypothetical protein
MKLSTFSKVLTKHRVELSDLQGKSKVWFDTRARDMRSVGAMSSAQLMAGDSESKGSIIRPGHLYMFVYDPKYKKTLPYYDTFPMVFPFKAERDGFYGLNIHYLPYRLRAQLMDRLMEFKTDSRYDERTRLKLQWQLLDGSSRFAMVKPCVKHYLYEHVRSPFKAVHSSDWATALMLPVENFEKASAQQVWMESTRIIKSV